MACMMQCLWWLSRLRLTTNLLKMMNLVDLSVAKPRFKQSERTCLRINFPDNHFELISPTLDHQSPYCTLLKLAKMLKSCNALVRPRPFVACTQPVRPVLSFSRSSAIVCNSIKSGSENVLTTISEQAQRVSLSLLTTAPAALIATRPAWADEEEFQEALDGALSAVKEAQTPYDLMVSIGFTIIVGLLATVTLGVSRIYYRPEYLQCI